MAGIIEYLRAKLFLEEAVELLYELIVSERDQQQLLIRKIAAPDGYISQLAAGDIRLEFNASHIIKWEDIERIACAAGVHQPSPQLRTDAARLEIRGQDVYAGGIIRQLAPLQPVHRSGVSELSAESPLLTHLGQLLPVIDAVEMPLFIAGRAFDSRGVGLLDIPKPGRGFRHIQKIPDVRFLCLLLRRLFKGSRLCLLLLCSSAVQRTVFLRNRDIPSSPGKSAAASRAQQKEDKQRCQEPISSFLHFLLLSHRQACL